MAVEIVPRLAEWSEQDRADYFAHNHDLPLTSISDRVELDRALGKIDALLDQGELSRGSQRYLDALADLVAVYESRHVHFPRAGGVAILRYLMEEHNLQQRDLAALFGSKSIISEVLSGKRRLALAHIAKLSAYFGVPGDVFLDSADTEDSEQRRTLQHV